jgi:membrane protease YdiL (CAAX protease family)
VALLVLVALTQVFLSIVSSMVAGAFGFAPSLMALTGLVNLLAVCPVLWLAVRMARRPVREIFPFDPVPWGVWLAVPITAVGASILGSELANLTSMLLPLPDWMGEMFSEFETVSLAGILTLVLVAPVTEELLMRGAVLQGFLRRYSVRKAIVASAFLFGALHLNPWQFGPAMFLGIIYGWWCVHTRSVAPALVGHTLNNAIGVAVGGLLGVEIQGFTGETAGRMLQPFWFDLLGAVLLGLGLVLARRSFVKPARS